MKIEVIGLGYIGLPTAALLASKGLEVHGSDIDDGIVQTINEGSSPIVEPGLEKIISKVVNSGNLKASSDCKKADVFIITVQTPLSRDNLPDMSYVEKVAQVISPLLEKGNLILLESTSPVGSTESLSHQLSLLRKDLRFPKSDSEEEADINIAYCPERVMPGSTISELVSNSRIIGGISKDCARKASEFYNFFVEGECLKTNARTAELCKLSENAFRDVNIAFANELSIISEENDINVWELIKLTNKHPRVDILQPGPGVGGHCLAVDPWFIVASNPRSSNLIKLARQVNNDKTDHIFKKIFEEIKKSGDPSSLSICLMGLSYKADSDDLRESPAIKLLERILTLNLKSINVIEPNIEDLPNSLASSNVILTSLEEGIKNSAIIILLVGHNEFKDPYLKEMISGKILIDTVGLLD